MTQSFEFQGWTLVQELDENYHYMIFDPEGRFRLHAACTKKIESQEEAEHYIQELSELSGSDKLEKLFAEEEEG